MTDQDVNNFATNVIRLLREDLGRFDNATETVIKNSIIYEMRHWTYVTPRQPAKRVEQKEPEETIKARAFEMFSQGIPKTEVKDTLKIHKSTADKYYRNWKETTNTGDYNKEWYRENYPGLHEAMYDGLVNGTISPNIIRRNRW